MSKVPYTRKNHCHTMLVGGLNDLRVANRSARLDNAFDSSFCSLVNTVAEGKERIGTEHRPLGCRVRFLNTQLDRIHPAHLTGADAYGSAAFGQNDGIRFHMLGHSPSEIEVRQFPF